MAPSCSASIPTTGKVTATTPLPEASEGADGIAVGANHVWVTVSQRADLYRLDARTARVTGHRDLGALSSLPVVGYGAVWICVANPGSTMLRVDQRTMRDTLAINSIPGDGGRFSAGYGSMWRHDIPNGGVLRFDSRTGKHVATIRVTPEATAARRPRPDADVDRGRRRRDLGADRAQLTRLAQPALSRSSAAARGSGVVIDKEADRAHQGTAAFVAGLLAIAGAALATPGIGILSAPVHARGTIEDDSSIRRLGIELFLTSFRGTGRRMSSRSRSRWLAGGTTGWHGHPGPVLVTVKSGELTVVYTDDHGCEGTTYKAGQSFVDFGNVVHTALNRGPVPVDFWATYRRPGAPGSAFRIDSPNHEQLQLLSGRAIAEPRPGDAPRPRPARLARRAGKRTMGACPPPSSAGRTSSPRWRSS